MLAQKIIFTVSYLLVGTGSVGMWLFATKFPFSSAAWQLEYAQERIVGLNGYQVWNYSWIAIILGTLGQILGTWVC